MAKLNIKLLESVNDLKFYSTASEIHMKFGNNFQKNEERNLSQTDKDFLDWVDTQFAEMTGQPKEVFSKYNDDKYDFDDSDKSDYYPFARIDYDEKNRFEAIEIYSDQQTELIVNGNDFSDFNLQKLLTLADDFISEENNTAYISQKKQISIWCPDSDNKVECVLFARPGYFNS